MRSQLTGESIPGADQAVVGAALKLGQLPARPLVPGDRVLVVRTPDPATVAAEPAGQPVLPETLPAVVAGITAADPTGIVVVDLVVSAADGPALAIDATAGRVAVILLPRNGG